MVQYSVRFLQILENGGTAAGDGASKSLLGTRYTENYVPSRRYEYCTIQGYCSVYVEEEMLSTVHAAPLGRY